MADKGRERARFKHDVGDLVLVKWEDGMVYFAKIKRVDWRKKRCTVVFDDRSTDEAPFSQIHSVDETTTDIICIKCKKDDSESPNEIVLCDSCGIGFHQKCHNPFIAATALELNNPWQCVYCDKGTKNPYLTESIDAMQSLFEEDDTDMMQGEGIHSLDIVIKQEKLSDSEDEVAYSLPQPQMPSITGKRKGRPPLDASSRKKSKQGTRPLDALRKKYAKAHGGRNTEGWKRRNTRRSEAQTPSVESHTLSVTQVTRSMSALHSKQNHHRLDNGRQEEEEEMQQEVSVDKERNIAANSSNNNGTMRSYSSSSSSDEIIEEPPAAKRPRSLRVSLTLPPSSPLLSGGSKQGSPRADQSMECETSSMSPLVRSVRVSLSSNSSMGKSADGTSVENEANVSKESMVDDVFTDAPLLVNCQASNNNDSSSTSPVVTSSLSAVTSSEKVSTSQLCTATTAAISPTVTSTIASKPITERPTELPLLQVCVPNIRKVKENSTAPATKVVTSANSKSTTISPMITEGMREPSPLERLQMEIRGSRLLQCKPASTGSTALATIKAKQIKLASVASSSYDRRKSQSDKAAITHTSYNKEVISSSSVITTTSTTSAILATSTNAPVSTHAPVGTTGTQGPIASTQGPIASIQSPIASTPVVVNTSIANTQGPVASTQGPIASTPVVTSTRSPVANSPIANTQGPVADTPVADTTVASTPIASTPVVANTQGPATNTTIAKTTTAGTWVPIQGPVASTPVASTTVASTPIANTLIANTPQAVASTTTASTSIVASTPVVVTSVPNTTAVIRTSNTDNSVVATAASGEGNKSKGSSVVVISPSPSPPPVKISPVNVSGRKMIMNNRQSTQATHHDSNPSSVATAKVWQPIKPKGTIDSVFSKQVIEATRSKAITSPPAVAAQDNAHKICSPPPLNSVTPTQTTNMMIPASLPLPPPPPLTSNKQQQNSVVMTPTTVPGTGEVATVYTLVPSTPVSPPQTAVINNNPATNIAADAVTNHNHHHTSSAGPVVYTAQPSNGHGVTYAAIPVQAVTTPTTQYYMVGRQASSGQATTLQAVHHQPSPGQATTLQPVAHPAVLSTTKPYAVVNAVPATTQQPHIIKSPPPPPASLKIPPPSTVSGTVHRTVLTSGRHTRKSTTPHHLPQRAMSTGTPTNPGTNVEHVVCNSSSKEEETSSEIAHHLEQLSHKYREQKNLSEDKLMEVFQDAWNKFQTNGKKYEQYGHKQAQERQIRSPNMEVVSYSSVPVQMSRSYSNYRSGSKYATGSGTSPVTTGVSLLPKQPVMMKNATPQAVTTNNSMATTKQYIIQSPQQQQQVLHHRTYQTNGVFVPPASKQVAMSHGTTNAVVSRAGQAYLVTEMPPAASTHSTTLVQRTLPAKDQTKIHQNTIHHNNQLHQQRALLQLQQQRLATTATNNPRASTGSSSSSSSSKMVRICALCGKSATFLCSGCQKEWYCSRECQVKSWNAHAKLCNKS